jgi:hypothetical protein
MKPTNVKTLVAGALGALLLLVVAGTAAAETLDFQERFSPARVDRISVDDRRVSWGIIIRNDIDTTISLFRADGDDITVSLSGEVKSNRRRCLPALEARERGGSLQIAVTTCSGPTAFLSMSGRMDLEIGVPAGWRGEYRVNASSADVTAEGIELGEAELDVSSGSIQVSELDAEELRLSSSSGRIDAEEIRVSGELSVESSSGSQRLSELQAADIRLDSSSGSMSVEDVAGRVRADASSGSVELDFAGNSGQAAVDTSSGRVEVCGLRGTVDLETSSGDVRVDLAELTGDSTIQTSSGDVRVGLPSESAFTVDLDTSSGRVTVDFPVTVSGPMGQDTVRGTVNGGGPVLEVDTSSGDIELSPRAQF